MRAAQTAIPLFIPGHTLSTCRSLDTRPLGSTRKRVAPGYVPAVPVFPSPPSLGRRVAGVDPARRHNTVGAVPRVLCENGHNAGHSYACHAAPKLLRPLHKWFGILPNAGTLPPDASGALIAPKLVVDPTTCIQDNSLDGTRRDVPNAPPPERAPPQTAAGTRRELIRAPRLSLAQYQASCLALSCYFVHLSLLFSYIIYVSKHIHSQSACYNAPKLLRPLHNWFGILPNAGTLPPDASHLRCL